MRRAALSRRLPPRLNGEHFRGAGRACRSKRSFGSYSFRLGDIGASNVGHPASDSRRGAGTGHAFDGRADRPGWNRWR